MRHGDLMVVGRGIVLILIAAAAGCRSTAPIDGIGGSAGAERDWFCERSLRGDWNCYERAVGFGGQTQADAPDPESASRANRPPGTERTQARKALPPYLQLAYRTDGPVEVLDLPPHYFAVQIAASSSLESLDRILVENRLPSMTAMPTEQDGEPLYVLLAGIYVDRQVADRAAALLPAEIRAMGPWVRQLGPLQDTMRRAEARPAASTDTESAPRANHPPGIGPTRASTGLPPTPAYRSDAAMGVMDLPAHYFAVQILASSSLAPLDRILVENRLPGMTVVRTERDGEPLYVLLAGVYVDRQVADRAAALLPAEIRAMGPWVRQLGPLQDTMRRAEARPAASTDTESAPRANHPPGIGPTRASTGLPPTPAYRSDAAMGVMDLPAHYFAVQIAASSSFARLDRILVEKRLPGMTSVRVEQDGEPLYVLLAGVYADRQAADRAAALLPADIRAMEPWVRQLGPLQDAMGRAEARLASVE